MLKRLLITPAQAKAGNTFEELLNEIVKLYILCVEQKRLLKKVYNNIMNSSIKLSDRMDTIFLNSGNSKKSDLHRLLLNLSDKTNLKRSDKYVALSNLSIYYAQKKHKKS